MKILVIDNDSTERALIKGTLEDFLGFFTKYRKITPPHVVKTAINGEEALSKIKKRFFDLVITESKLPGILGEEVIRQINLSNPETKTIMMAFAFNVGAASEEAKNAGADAFLDKNKILQNLESTIKQLFPKLRL